MFDAAVNLDNYRKFLENQLGMSAVTVQNERYEFPDESGDAVESGYVLGEVWVKFYEDGSRTAARSFHVTSDPKMRELYEFSRSWFEERQDVAVPLSTLEQRVDG